MGPIFLKGRLAFGEIQRVGISKGGMVGIVFAF